MCMECEINEARKKVKELDYNIIERNGNNFKNSKKAPFDIIDLIIGNFYILEVLKEQKLYGKEKSKYWIYVVYNLNKKEIKTVTRTNLNHFDDFPKKIPKESFSDLTGRVFGRLKVIGKAPRIKNKKQNYWYCNCSCGGEKSKNIIVSTSDLLNKRVQSCGCLKEFRGEIPKEKYIGKIKNGWKILGFKTKKDDTYWDVECICCGEKRTIKDSVIYKTFCYKQVQAGKEKLKNMQKNLKIKKPPINIKDLTGVIFNKIKVLGYCDKVLAMHYWVCQCECGTKFLVRSDAIHTKKFYSCGCVNSLGEEKIANFLNDYNINFLKQYKFKDCTYKKELKFDFLIYYPNSDNFFMLEYQGKQHEEPTSFGGDSSKEAKEKNLKYNQIRDNIKREYCKNNNIELIEISYKDFDKIEKILAKKLRISI